MNRPSLFALVAVPLLASSAWSQAATLREAATAAGINFGTATNSNQVRDASSAYATIVKTQFSMVVCENEMKFESTESPIGTYKYGGGDGVAAFAKANNIKLRGHNFIWHSQSTPAQSAVTDRTSGLKVMHGHIENVGTHFKDDVYEWDVLNETYSGGTRSLWYKIGADYTDSALSIARKVLGTSAYLVSNDYGADGVNSKSTAILAIAKGWQDHKVPIDGIGFQCHLGSGIRKDDISANIKRFGDLGLRVSLTEIDITNSKAADWTNLMNACLENFNCVNFVTWGLADGNSWLGSGCGGCLLYSGSSNSAQPHQDIIDALIDAMKKADPTIAAKRKAFAALPPGSLGPGTVIGLYDLSKPAAHRGKNLSGLAPMPVFSTSTGGVVDPLGRVKSFAPARINGLEILTP
jgi:endo-1,4-beta-xylanase